ncbi:hypothetical protein EX30DRAFT_397751 [Ascodesmis nigricans]|uniref:Family A G protein-coupled receptor-like protein n=1 Tax=Ascodesmis nigricans TaxID=341454 RepID=A0A4S2MRE3_9PEZI|nr:hypothetical protein EX30DRAFT_397751 [Ascodesmis nigricans]
MPTTTTSTTSTTTNIWINDPILGLTMLSKGLGEDEINDDRPILTREQLVVLRSIAIAAATLSILSGLLVGWWFARMKRSFRHHLIMLLIFSDFFKASWQLIYPSVVFSRGLLSSRSRFCQLSGFMMSFGIEASDFAVLAIAVHSALYIFRPGMGGIGEGGLYRYRRYVYVTWLAFSTVMPALAFVNKNPAYSAQGTYCYLPVRPFWYRLALAWIPRYIILTTIMILYAAIYIYVRMKFRTFRTSVGADALDLDSIDLAQPPVETAIAAPPRLPSLDVHGLIPPPSPTLQPKYHNRNSDVIPFARAFLNPLWDKIHSPSSSSSASENSSDTTSPSRRGSVPTIMDTDLEKQRQQQQQHHSPTHHRHHTCSSASSSLQHRRLAINRQLRLLFIYPLIYALMWVPPLVAHALQFTERFVHHPNFPLQCVVAFTLPFQCAVDCWLFTIREKPWTYIPEARGGGWWARYGFWGRGERGEGDCEWRGRKHLSREARKAYERREGERREAAAARGMGEVGGVGGVEGVAPVGGEGVIGAAYSMRGSRTTERSWWDVEEQRWDDVDQSDVDIEDGECAEEEFETEEKVPREKGEDGDGVQETGAQRPTSEMTYFGHRVHPAATVAGEVAESAVDEIGGPPGLPLPPTPPSPTTMEMK